MFRNLRTVNFGTPGSFPLAVSLLGTNLKREKPRVNIDSCHYPLTSELHRSQGEEVNVSRKPRIVHLDRVESSRILSDDEPMFTRIYLPVSGALRRLTEVSSRRRSARSFKLTAAASIPFYELWLLRAQARWRRTRAISNLLTVDRGMGTCTLRTEGLLELFEYSEKASRDISTRFE